VGAALAAVGAGVSLWRPQAPGRRGVLALLVVYSLTVLGLALALAISAQSVYLVPGRYLLPALPAMALALVAGWRALAPGRRVQRLVWQAFSLGLVVVGWLI